VKINNLDTCCEQAGRRGKDYEAKLFPVYTDKHNKYKNITVLKEKAFPSNYIEFCSFLYTWSLKMAS
jgi:hypothetical protein